VRTRLFQLLVLGRLSLLRVLRIGSVLPLTRLSRPPLVVLRRC
jgi:hypothetical protein